LFVGVFDVGDDGNFLTVGATFDKNFWRILRIVWGQECHHILVHGAGRWTAVRLHHLVKDVVQQHQRIPNNGGGSGGWGNLEGIINVGIKRAVHCAVYVAHCVVVVLLAGEGGGDAERLFVRVWDNGGAVRGIDWWEIGDSGSGGQVQQF
jgi:hypothetical protein